MADRGFPHQAGAVRHQPPERDSLRLRRTGGRAGGEARQVLGDFGVEVEFAALVERRRREVGEEFGDRAHPEQGVHIHRDARPGLAEALRPDDPVALHQRQREAGDALGLEFLDDEVADPGGEVRVARVRADPRRRPRRGRAAAAAGEQRRREGEAGEETGAAAARPAHGSTAFVHCGSFRVSGAGPSSSSPGARLPSASSKKSAIRFQKIAFGG